MLVTGVIVLLITLALVYRRAIGRRLDAVAAALTEIADGDGDLSRTLDASGQHEVSRIGAAFNTFADKLALTIADVREVTAELSSVSSALIQTAQQTGQQVSAQEGETQQVATAVNEMQLTARENARSAGGEPLRPRTNPQMQRVPANKDVASLSLLTRSVHWPGVPRNLRRRSKR